MFVCLLALILPCAVAAQGPLLPVNRIRAVVGDKPITQSQIEREYGIILQGKPRPDSAAAEKDMAQVLELLIQAHVFEHIATVEKITLPDEAVENEVERKVREARSNFPDQATFVTALKQNGFANEEEFRRFQEKGIRAQYLPDAVRSALRNNRKLPAITVPDSIIDQRVAAQRDQVGPKPALVGFRQIVVPTQASEASRKAAKAKADSVEVLLQRGANFDSLARIVSMDSLRREGGNLGLRKRGAFDADFERWYFNLTPGNLSPVFETSYGYHIIKVERREAAQVQGRHIVIVPQLDSSDFARAKVRADSAAAMLRAGEPFDSVLAKFNDPAANSSPTIPSYKRDDLPPDFANALRDKKVGEIVGPFTATDLTKKFPAYVIAVVTLSSEGGPYSNEELREMIRGRVEEMLAMAEYYERVKKQLFIRIFD